MPDELFGKAGPRYLHLIREILPKVKPVTHRIGDDFDYFRSLQNDITTGNKVFAEELLFRIYMAAVSSLHRNEQWFSAALNAPNHFSLYASLRGFLESTTDSAYSLQNIPAVLMSNLDLLKGALNQQLSAGILTCPELEELAIHFTHARRETKEERKTMDPNHKAKGANQYINKLDANKKLGLEALYADLCELTHPASASVVDFISWNEKKKECTTHPSSKNMYSIVITRHHRALSVLPGFAFNSTFALLKFFNVLPMRKLHTPIPKSIDLGNMLMWSDVDFRNDKN